MSREEIGQVLDERSDTGGGIGAADPGPAQAVATSGGTSRGEVGAGDIDTARAPAGSRYADDPYADDPYTDGRYADGRYTDGIGSSRPPDPNPWSHRDRLLAMLAAVLVGVGAGWFGGGAWNATPDQPGTGSGPAAAAVVINVGPSSGSAIRTGADLVVQLTNLGGTGLTLAGAEASFDAGQIAGVSPPGLPIPPGTTATAVLHVAIACGSPQPLRLPDLQVRGADRVLRTIPVDGSAAALARLCDLQPAAVHMLELISTTPDGDRLRLQIRSPTGRTVQLDAVSARGVALTGRPIPGAVDALGRTIWIDPPPNCPASWLGSGLPRTLDLRVDGGGDSTVSLDLGYSLARWVRAGPCAGAQQ